jgi:hypothetical protein
MIRELINILSVLLLYLSALSLHAQSPYDRFEKLWTDFNLNYSYVELKEVDRDAVKDKYSPLFQKSMSTRKEAPARTQCHTTLVFMPVQNIRNKPEKKNSQAYANTRLLYS